MAQSFALKQHFADGSNGNIGEYYSTLIPVDRLPPRIVEIMNELNGTAPSECGKKAVKMVKELEDFLETCKDCVIEFDDCVVKLPAGASVTILCQTF